MYFVFTNSLKFHNIFSRHILNTEMRYSTVPYSV